MFCRFSKEEAQALNHFVGLTEGHVAKALVDAKRFMDQSDLNDCMKAAALVYAAHRILAKCVYMHRQVHGELQDIDPKDFIRSVRTLLAVAEDHNDLIMRGLATVDPENNYDVRIDRVPRIVEGS